MNKWYESLDRKMQRNRTIQLVHPYLIKIIEAIQLKNETERLMEIHREIAQKEYQLLLLSDQVKLLTSFRDIPIIRLPDRIEVTTFNMLAEPIKTFINKYYTLFKPLGEGDEVYKLKQKLNEERSEFLDITRSYAPKHQKYIDDIVEVINKYNKPSVAGVAGVPSGPSGPSVAGVPSGPSGPSVAGVAGVPSGPSGPSGPSVAGVAGVAGVPSVPSVAGVAGVPSDLSVAGVQAGGKKNRQKRRRHTKKIIFTKRRSTKRRSTKRRSTKKRR